MAMIKYLMTVLALSVTLGAANFSPALNSIHIHALAPVAAAGVVEPHVSGSAGQSSQLYHVMGIVLLAWCGIALYLFFLDRRVSRLERELRTLGKHGDDQQ